MSMFNDTIKKRVMEVVKMKIAVAEVDYQEGCKKLDEKLQEDKEALANKLVENITHKLF